MLPRLKTEGQTLNEEVRKGLHLLWDMKKKQVFTVRTCRPKEKPWDWKSTSGSREQGKTEERDWSLQSGNWYSLLRETYIRGMSWATTVQNGSPHSSAGTREFYKVKGWIVMGTSVWMPPGMEITLRAWPGQDNNLFQEPAQSRSRGAADLCRNEH